MLPGGGPEWLLPGSGRCEGGAGRLGLKPWLRPGTFDAATRPAGAFPYPFSFAMQRFEDEFDTQLRSVLKADEYAKLQAQRAAQRRARRHGRRPRA
ncbi:hypothetical protein GCM10027044_06220 [Hymenobacter ruber]